MSQIKPARNHGNQQFSRRDVLKLGGGLLGALAGSVALPKALLKPEEVAAAASVKSAARASVERPAYQDVVPDKHLAGTDGWIHLPGDPRPPYFPDNMAPDPKFNTYIFGYHDVTGVAPGDLINYKMKAQLAAPVLILKEDVPYYLKLTNLGLQLRPDLIDAHTVHFHGFRNAIPIFDGEPHSSVGVPIIRDLTYYYLPRDPGTYMYHCHFEETEHVHMGMIGPAFIRPAMGDKFVYNDESTAFDREFYLCLSEVWLEAHWADSHIQLPEWSDYKPEFYLINGRSYPDTIVGNGSRDGAGNMVGPDGRPDLVYQPVTSLITANEGDRVVLRVNNLGFETVTMTMAGIKMRVIARDAVQLKGKGADGAEGADLSYLTSSFTLGSGESTDVIFTAPPYQGVNGAGNPDKYLFYSRNLAPLNNAGWAGKGGQMTEVHVYPTGTLGTQSEPNT